jgi:thiol-disulfide isomerase/thioredoxin
VYPASQQQQSILQSIIPASHTAMAVKQNSRSSKTTSESSRSQKSAGSDTAGKVFNVKNSRDLAKVKKLYENNEPMVILIYRDTCGFCEMMKPAWISFSPKAVTQGVHVVNIDSSVMDSVVPGKSIFADTLKKSFEGFVPFVMKMNGPNDHAVYNGNRTPEDFARFALTKKKSSKSTPGTRVVKSAKKN